MDDKRFDDVARALGSGTSRRTLLKILGGALGAAVAGRSAQVAADPECRGEGHPCEGNQDCCAGLQCVAGGGNGNAERCVKIKKTTTTKKPTTTTKKPTTTTKKPTTTTKKPTTTTKKPTTTTKKPTTTTKKY